MSSSPPTVGLFVTCLVNLFRPAVGFASIQLLEAAGCRVEVPESQTCCGQPTYNPGDFDGARQMARQVIQTFEVFDYTVAPSGSCAGMLREHYPRLLQDDKAWLARAELLAAKTFELTGFLRDIRRYEPEQPIVDLSQGHFTYHDACAGLRELKIRNQPRELLKACNNIQIDELKNPDECCGFGGTFCAKMPGISQAMVDDKLDNALATGADTLLGGDMGCLLNIAGRATRRGDRLDVRHVAEVLADELSHPPIGAGEKE